MSEPMEGGAQEEEDELPMYQEHYNALFSMDFVETKYPHMRKDRADLDQGLGWITFLAKGEKRMVTFRQLGDLVWVQLWRGVELQGKELQRVWATIADGGTLPQGPRLLRSGAQS
ncbi:unnamed protein product [Microthlaspi erraticum]|uniref:Uncharacterized protein n=1 Tax=Microthlaspi erraticum TaxID=1685480 RepID=A0A6D2K1X6_9BRAS|nr:unnamed protein product [Microthlaspi erraticum]